MKRREYETASTMPGTIADVHGSGKIRLGRVSFSIAHKSRELICGVEHLLVSNGILNPGTAMQ
ncbi:MAG: hypothetical protein ACOC7M_02870 [Chloroflexota bacterium]